jgi:itaconate CoA-transferase
VGSPVGPIRALVPPVTMQGVESVMEPIPEVGEHTDAILEELDLDPDAVGSLREAGAV